MIIIDNNFYKKYKDFKKNSVKYKIPFETEKVNLIKTLYKDIGHLGENRTWDKIIEKIQM